FYIDVLELSEQNAKPGDPNHYLSDGKMTLMIMPWRIKNYLGTSILPTGMDHIGFTVENVDKLKDDVEELVGINPVLNPIPVGKGKESAARLDLLRQQCPIGEYFLSDPDFTMLPARSVHCEILGRGGALRALMRLRRAAWPMCAKAILRGAVAFLLC